MAILLLPREIQREIVCHLRQEDRFFFKQVCSELYSIVLDHRDCIKCKQHTLDESRYRKFIDNADLAKFAIENEYLSIMKWLSDIGYEWNAYDFNVSIEVGNLDNMKWLQSQGCPSNDLTCYFAANNGSVDNMRWLQQQGYRWQENILTHCEMKGGIDNIPWLFRVGQAWNNDLFENLSRDTVNPHNLLQ